MIDQPDRDAAGPRPKPRTVYVHIGMMKTGTSFLQAVVLRNVALLARAGVLFPMTDNRWSLQVRAARDVLGIKGARPSDGDWDTLVEQVHAHQSRASLVSMEFLSFASPEVAERIVTDLTSDDRQVDVVITARDLTRIMPSAWQSMIKQGHPWPFDEFVRSVTGVGEADPEPGRRFWKHHDLVAIVQRWIEQVGPEHVHLVTVPPPGAPPDLLWHRFADVLGVDPARFDITQNRSSNFSLSYSETELLRQVNLAIDGRISKLAQKRWVARWLANRVMRSDEVDGSDLPTLDAAARAWVETAGKQAVADLRQLPMQVHGDLDDLLPPAAAPADPAAAGPLRSQPAQIPVMIAAMLVRLAQVDPEMPDGVGPPISARDAGDEVDDDLDDLESFEDDAFDDGPGR